VSIESERAGEDSAQHRFRNESHDATEHPLDRTPEHPPSLRRTTIWQDLGVTPGAATTTAAPSTDAAPARSPFRPDIQGLRAIAVAGVVLYHAGVPFLPGGFAGVDVFFVISGFLITNHLVAEISATGRLRFGRFYARRARRILPASFAVLLVSILACVQFAPRALAPKLLQDALATAFYVPNYSFAAQGTDYLAETAPSPFQHYWSLGVEEQFYLLWPLGLLLLWWLVRRSRPRLAAVVAGVATLSFAYGAILTFDSQPWAFFSLPSRAWEFALGGLVALAAPLVAARLSPVVAAILSWTGLALLLGSYLVLSPQTAYPGVAAALPVVGTAVAILGGIVPAPGSSSIVLRRRPFQFLGDISYSLYLVHWPLLIVTELALGTGGAPAWLPIVLAAASVPLGWLLRAGIERPFLQAGWARRLPSGAILGGALAVSLALGGASWVAGSTIAAQPLASDRTASPAGGPSKAPEFTPFVPADMTPSLKGAADDLPAIYADGCHVNSSSSKLPPACHFGDTGSHAVVALFGDSHAAQWFPALDALGKSHGFRLDVFTKSSCPSADLVMVTEGVTDTACSAWRAKVIAHLQARPPARIVLSNFSHYPAAGTPITSERWAAGLRRTLAELPSSSKVTVISDTPDFPTTPDVCLSAHLDDADACAEPRSKAFASAWNDAERRTARAHGAQVVNVDDYLCSSTTCGRIIGDALVYRDQHHLTASYASKLAPALGRAFGWW
jgi:peptidoglycan/LPS O-acetylase OafA/YrhL